MGGSLLLNLGITLFLEFLILWVCMRRQKFLSLLLFCILMNGFTLPLATWAYGEWGWNYFVVEGAVILTEALILAGFWKMNLLRAGGISLLSNGFSALVGLLLTPNGFALVFHLA